MLRNSALIISLAALAPASAFVSHAPSSSLALRAAGHGAFAAPLRSSVLQAPSARSYARSPALLKMQTEGDATPLERVCAILPYALPLSDVFTWGRYAHSWQERRLALHAHSSRRRSREGLASLSGIARYLFNAFPLLALPFVPLFPVMQLLNAPFISFGAATILRPRPRPAPCTCAKSGYRGP